MKQMLWTSFRLGKILFERVS